MSTIEYDSDGIPINDDDDWEDEEEEEEEEETWDYETDDEGNECYSGDGWYES